MSDSVQLRLCKDCGEPKPKESYQGSQWVLGNPRCRECIRVRNQDYWIRNQARIKVQQARHYQENREAILTSAKQRWVERKHLYEPARQTWAAAHQGKMLSYYRDRGQTFRAWLAEQKAEKPCADCGKVFAAHVMEYDHVRGEKRHNISKMSNHKHEQVLAEIAKCDLVCCVCHRIRSHVRRNEPKTARLVAFRAWISERKKQPCSDCGAVFPPEAMDFDHIEKGSKVQNITDMWSWGHAKLLVELAKCELVCANCHRDRSVLALRSEGLAWAS